VPATANDLQITPPAGLAMDAAGSSYVVGPYYSTAPVDFQTRPAGPPVLIASTGDADLFIGAYDSAGNISWAQDIGDDDPSAGQPQVPVGAGVTADGNLAVIGNFLGTMTFGSKVISSANNADFLAVVSASSGARQWARKFSNGSNGALVSVATNPGSALNTIAVCGRTNAAAIDLVGAGTVYGGGSSDAVVGLFDSAGNKKWALELGNGAYYENCQAVAIDDHGDVFAAGQFDSASLVFAGASSNITLTGPAAAAGKKFIWVAKFSGATGKVLAAKSLTTNLGQAGVTSLTTDAAGNLIVGGVFGNTVNIGTVLLTSAGGSDGFLAKLDGAGLSPIWDAVRFGGDRADAINSVAVTAQGEIVATGSFKPASSTFQAANAGYDTSGIAQLHNGGTSSLSGDIFVLKIDGATGTLQSAAAYGDASDQSGDGVVVNRYGSSPNQVSLVGTLSGSATFGAAGTATAKSSSGIDAVLVTAALK
jgi:hypothetical protein